MGSGVKKNYLLRGKVNKSVGKYAVFVDKLTTLWITIYFRTLCMNIPYRVFFNLIPLNNGKTNYKMVAGIHLNCG